VSSDGKFLYVLNPSIFLPGPPGTPPGASQIDVYRIGPGGSLTPIPNAVSGDPLPFSVSGLGVN
jgi:hypothetical protein